MRRAIFAVSALVAIATTVVDTHAQSSGTGRVVRTHWPDMIYETAGAMDVPFSRAAEQFADVDLLPALDSLVLDYTWATMDGIPRLGFDLSWAMGGAGVMDGRPVSTAELPDSIVMRLIDLQAEVFVGRERVGDLVLTLDSLSLPPDPYLYAFEVATTSWDSLFAGMDAAAARRAFEEGFELRNLDILRVSFEGFDLDASPEREVRVVHRVPRRRTIFVPDPGIWIGWDLGPDPYRPPPGRSRGAVRPRGSDTGRDATTSRGSTRRGTNRGSDADPDQASERGSDRTGTKATDERRGIGDLLRGNSGKDKKDDDKDRDLLGPALVGAAAVGLLAAIGGSVGIAGWSDAPIGLAGGRLTARGGWLVHGAVSADVITGGADEVLRLGATGYWRPLPGGFMPGLGLGSRLHEEAGITRADLAVEIAGAVRFGRVFLLGGVDVVSPGGRVGIVVALRDPERR